MKQAMVRALLLVASAICCSGSKFSEDGNPKESNAVKMVISMIEGLHDKVTAEGETEEKTFTKFDTWCTDTLEEKTGEITEGGNAKTALEGKIEQFTTEKGQEEKKIQDAEVAIAAHKKSIAEEKAARQAAHKDYKKDNAEFEHAAKASGEAIKAIKASFKEAAFLQQTELVARVRHLSVMADTLAMDNAREAVQFLDSLGDSEEGDDESWTSGRDVVVTMLEDLEKEFRGKDETSDMDEAKAETAHKLKIQALEQGLAAEEEKLENAEAEKNDRIRRIAQSKEDLSDTIQTLADNNKYKEETTLMCTEKKATFDQRKAARTEELATLVKAKNIVQEAMKKDGAALISEGNDVFLIDVAAQASNDPTLLASAESEAEAEEDKTGVFSAPSFFQSSNYRSLRVARVPHFHRSNLPASRHQHIATKQETQLLQTSSKNKLPQKQQDLVDLLTQQAEATKSPRLVLLARKAAAGGADPFGHIKDMIAQMIEKLQAQASESQDKKMKCDKDIGAGEAKRDKAYGKVKALNQQLMDEEARISKLTEDITVLTDEMEKMTEAQAEAQELRDEEKAENAASIKEAAAALDGVKQALTVLNLFYGKAAENEVEVKLAAQKPKGPAGDAPDAGFKNHEANKGSQAASKGIVGMMEVIASDFERTIRETEEEETAAAKKHAEFLDETAVSVAKKTKSKELKTGQKSKTNQEHSEDSDKLKVQIGALKSGILELVALEEECGAGAGYAARKANREIEIKSMKEAIEVIDKMMMEQ